jgi:Ca2+-binding EF-hand superfamily protein
MSVTIAQELSSPTRVRMQNLALGAAHSASGRTRTNHLGQSVNLANRSRVKYARTVTIVYESDRDPGSHSDAARIALLREMRKLYDFSVEALHGIFNSFVSVVRQGQSLIGPKTFRLLMARHGMRDTVIQQRLFQEFADQRLPERLDFRALIRVFCLLADDPLEAKLELLIDVYDLDLSGALSTSELLFILKGDDKSRESEDAVELLWAQMKVFLTKSSGSDDYWCATAT